MDALLNLPGGLERSFWQSQTTRQRLQLVDTLGLSFAMLINVAFTVSAVQLRAKAVLLLIVLGQLSQVGPRGSAALLPGRAWGARPTPTPAHTRASLVLRHAICSCLQLLLLHTRPAAYWRWRLHITWLQRLRFLASTVLPMATNDTPSLRTALAPRFERYLVGGFWVFLKIHAFFGVTTLLSSINHRCPSSSSCSCPPYTWPSTSATRCSTTATPWVGAGAALLAPGCGPACWWWPFYCARAELGRCGLNDSHAAAQRCLRCSTGCSPSAGCWRRSAARR
jgi:hypothetical protein